MNPATAIAIKAGLDTILNIWAALERKPEGWKPTVADWAALDNEVEAATPESRLLLAKLRAEQFKK